jgi:hypothetical protein
MVSDISPADLLESCIDHLGEVKTYEHMAINLNYTCKRGIHEQEYFQHIELERTC